MMMLSQDNMSKQPRWLDLMVLRETVIDVVHQSVGHLYHSIVVTRWQTLGNHHAIGWADACAGQLAVDLDLCDLKHLAHIQFHRAIT